MTILLLHFFLKRWPDGSPLLNFEMDIGNTDSEDTPFCAYIDVLNCFQWELFECGTGDRSTLCQAGKKVQILALRMTGFFPSVINIPSGSG